MAKPRAQTGEKKNIKKAKYLALLQNMPSHQEAKAWLPLDKMYIWRGAGLMDLGLPLPTTEWKKKRFLDQVWWWLGGLHCLFGLALEAVSSEARFGAWGLPIHWFAHRWCCRWVRFRSCHQTICNGGYWFAHGTRWQSNVTRDAQWSKLGCVQS